jgi:hypothetical protein
MRLHVPLPGTRSCYHVAEVRLPGAAAPQVHASRWAWRAEAGGTPLVAAFEPLADAPDSAGRGEALRKIRSLASPGARAGAVRGLVVLRRLAAGVTRVTFSAQASVEGGLGPAFLLPAAEGRGTFERMGEEVDGELRGAFREPPGVADLGEDEKVVARLAKQVRPVLTT